MSKTLTWTGFLWICGLAGTTLSQTAPAKPFEDAMEIGSRKLAGTRAIDCGRVEILESPERATKCGLVAFQQHKPFRVRYNVQGIDSNVAAGLALTEKGNLYEMSFDGDPRGGGGTSPRRQRWSKELCPKPFQVRVTKSGRLTCYSDQPVKNRSIMSPTFEPY
jgi:hypothetical protein